MHFLSKYELIPIQDRLHLKYTRLFKTYCFRLKLYNFCIIQNNRTINIFPLNISYLYNINLELKANRLAGICKTLSKILNNKPAKGLNYNHSRKIIT